jgi:GNAT superfamily N-acetyltransferase
MADRPVWPIWPLWDDLTDFQRFAGIIARQRGGEPVLGTGFAELPPGRDQPRWLGTKLAGECLLLGGDGALAWLGARRRGPWAAHLWDATPGIAERPLRAAGFGRRWSNAVLETRAGGPRAATFEGPAVTQLLTAEEHRELSRAIGPGNAPALREGARILSVGSPVAGAVSVSIEGDVAYLADLFVVPARRGRGLGRALIDAAVELARGEGAVRVWALPSRAARPLYERAGFSQRALLSTYLTRAECPDS